MSFVFVDLLLEYRKRGIDDLPAHGAPRQSLIDGNYCIDAVEVMPAGSMESYQWNDGEFMPMPTLIEREAIAGKEET